MHSLEFDAQIEQSINQLAIYSGKTPDDLLRDMVIQSLKSRSFKINANKEPPESISTDSWDSFFNKVSNLTAKRKLQDTSTRTLTDVTSPRDEIYADRLR